MIGIDIASVDGNKPVDWSKAYAAGVRFAYFRASYEKWKDPTWNAEAERARAAGITVGAYLFPVMDEGHPSPEDQVNAFAAAVHVGPGDLPPCIDIEFPHGIKPTRAERDRLIAWTMRAVAQLARMFGIAPMAYTSLRVFDGQDTDALDATRSTVDQTALADCPLWEAKYITDYHKAPITNVDGLPVVQAPKAFHGNVWIRQTQGDSIGLPGFTWTADINQFYFLKLGDTGERVKWVQRRLGMAEASGVFDQETLEAVQEFQRASELVADGVIGPATFARLTWSHPFVGFVG